MYLIVIYRLTQNQASASTTEIAARLAISQPSVTEQLKRLHSRPCLIGFQTRGRSGCRFRIKPWPLRSL